LWQKQKARKKEGSVEGENVQQSRMKPIHAILTFFLPSIPHIQRLQVLVILSLSHIWSLFLVLISFSIALGQFFFTFSPVP
jgi:hypothetical protein